MIETEASLPGPTTSGRSRCRRYRSPYRPAPRSPLERSGGLLPSDCQGSGPGRSEVWLKAQWLPLPAPDVSPDLLHEPQPRGSPRPQTPSTPPPPSRLPLPGMLFSQEPRGRGAHARRWPSAALRAWLALTPSWGPLPPTPSFRTCYRRCASNAAVCPGYDVGTTGTAVPLTNTSQEPRADSINLTARNGMRTDYGDRPVPLWSVCSRDRGHTGLKPDVCPQSQAGALSRRVGEARPLCPELLPRARPGLSLKTAPRRSSSSSAS